MSAEYNQKLKKNYFPMTRFYADILPGLYDEWFKFIEFLFLTGTMRYIALNSAGLIQIVFAILATFSELFLSFYLSTQIFFYLVNKLEYAYDNIPVRLGVINSGIGAIVFIKVNKLIFGIVSQLPNL